MSDGVVSFLYTKNLPANAVAIAQVAVPDMTPAQLTDVNNTPYLEGRLGVWFPTQMTPSLVWPAPGAAPTLAAPDYNESVMVADQITFAVENQFFDLTNVVDASGNPLYFMHPFSTSVTDVKVYDLDGNLITTGLFTNGVFYHDLVAGAYMVQTVDSIGIVTTTLMQRIPVLTKGLFSPTANTFVLTGKVIQVFNGSVPYYIRFTKPNGFQVLTPYNAPSNVPWFVRVRFSINQPPQEWLRQPFQPQAPYLMASWVQGTVLNSNVIQFERPCMYNNIIRRPDILIFDKDNVFKYALDGTPPNSTRQRGSQYDWVRGKIASVDGTSGLVQVNVVLEPTDIIWGFYPYQEPDILYTALDCNPFTNPAVENCFVQFYYRTDSDPLHCIYHQVIDPIKGISAGMTNDPNPFTTLAALNAASDIVCFAQVMINLSLADDQFTITDVRQRGGGVNPKYLGTPDTLNLWDSCYWDGKPYPLGATLAVYLPSTILGIQNRSSIQDIVQSVVPAGVTPVIHYIDPATGEESV